MIDPATKVKITLPSGAGAQLNLKEGFGEYVFEALAEPFTAIDYNSFNITWVSSKTGDVKTCQAKGTCNPLVKTDAVVNILIVTSNHGS